MQMSVFRILMNLDTHIYNAHNEHTMVVSFNRVVRLISIENSIKTIVDIVIKAVVKSIAF